MDGTVKKKHFTGQIKAKKLQFMLFLYALESKMILKF